MEPGPDTSRCMSRRGLLLALAAALTAGAARAQKAARRLVVDKSGALRVPAAVIREFKLEPADGLVCIQFPAPPPVPVPVRIPLRPRAPEQPLPPRVWLPLEKDGSLLLRRMRLIPGDDYAPGPAGTVYLARTVEGRLVLEDAPAAKPGSRRKS
jgi:hypothetical protein